MYISTGNNNFILEKALKEDQLARTNFKKGKLSLADLLEIDWIHQEILLNIINTSGFPTKTKFSKNAYKAAVIITLHSSNILLLENTISVLQNESPETVEKRDMAYLIDKLRVLKNKPQLYGTQFRKSAHGKIIFLPIEDEEHLEERRRKLNMESFEDYKNSIA
jgi:hypothetical protein